MTSILVDRFINGDVSEETEAEIVAHLETCGCCRERVEAMLKAAQHDPVLAMMKPQEREASSHAFTTIIPSKATTARTLPDGVFSPKPKIDPTTKCGNFGGYLATELLGKGGFATVYKAIKPITEELVAIKVLHPKKNLPNNPLAKMIKEAQESVKVKHDNIVKVQSVEEVDDYFFLVMDLVEGHELNKFRLPGVVTRKPHPNLADTIETNGDHISGSPMATVNPELQLSFIQFTNLVLQICDGLFALHTSSVIHRDLKPANILIETANATLRAKITDFGLAGSVAERRMAGTPPYMSPEQILGANCDETSDIYSLGVIMFQMLTGTLPFGTKGPKLKERVVRDATPSLRDRNPLVPKELEAITVRCLSKNPQKRYDSAMDLKQDLLCWLNNKPITAMNYGIAKRGALWIARNRTTFVITGLLTALLLAASVSAAIVSQQAEKNSRLAGEKSQLAETNGHMRDQAFERESNARQLLGEIQRAIVKAPKHPSTFGLKTELLGMIVHFYDELLEQYEQNPTAVEAEMAEALYRLAKSHASLEQPEIARLYFKKAESFFERIAHRQPLSEKENLLLAAYLSDRVILAEEIGANIDAGKSHDDSVSDIRDTNAKAAALLNQGRWIAEQENIDSEKNAREKFQEALNLLPSMDDCDHRQMVIHASLLRNLAELDFKDDESDEDAVTRLEPAIKAWDTLSKHEVYSPEHLQKLASSLLLKGRMQLKHALRRHGSVKDIHKTPDWYAGIDSLASAHEHFKRLADTFPDSADYQQQLGESSYYLCVELNRAEADKTISSRSSQVAKTAIDALERCQATQRDAKLHQMLVDSYVNRVNHATETLTIDDGPELNDAAASELIRLIQLSDVSAAAIENRLYVANYFARSCKPQQAKIFIDSVLWSGLATDEMNYNLACIYCNLANCDPQNADEYAKQALALLESENVLEMLAADPDNPPSKDPDLKWLWKNRPHEVKSIDQRLTK